MARKLSPERPVGDDRRPSPASHREGQRKVTMWLPLDLAKRLNHAAVEDERDIGQVAAPGIELALKGRYWVNRAQPGRSDRPAIALAPTPEADERPPGEDSTPQSLAG